MTTDFFDYVSERCCANCESEPAADDDLFCSDECRDEYEGTGDFWEDED